MKPTDILIILKHEICEENNENARVPSIPILNIKPKKIYQNMNGTGNVNKSISLPAIDYMAKTLDEGNTHYQ